MRLLRRLRAIGLPQWRLVAGCLYQTVWNVLTDRPRGTGIKDYDLTYFDPHDCSWEAEDAIIKRVTAAVQDCPGPVEVRNQARVHLWFEAHFGEAYAPLTCTDEALARFVAPAFAVGVRLEADGRLDIAAPFGLNDLFAMRLRPNPLRGLADGWEKVTASAQARWPEVMIDAAGAG